MHNNIRVSTLSSLSATAVTPTRFVLGVSPVSSLRVRSFLRTFSTGVAVSPKDIAVLASLTSSTSAGTGGGAGLRSSYRFQMVRVFFLALIRRGWRSHACLCCSGCAERRFGESGLLCIVISS